MHDMNGGNGLSRMICHHSFLLRLSYRFRWYLTICRIVFFGMLSHAQTSQETRILCREFIFGEVPFKQCHASNLIETAEGNILAVWFGGSSEGAREVCIWESIRQNGSWSSPVNVVCGEKADGFPLPCWNPVLFGPDDSTIILYYKQGNSPREWKGMSTVSRDGGKTWGARKPLDNLIGPVKSKPLITDSGTWLTPSSTETPSRWQVYMERSMDKGKTWERIPVDTANLVRVIQPCLLREKDGVLFALCRSDQNCIMESRSDDDGRSWSHLQKTGLPNPNSGIDAITLNSGLHLVVYNPERQGPDWWNGRNKLSVAISADGINWRDICCLEDQPDGEFSYPSVIQSKNGIIHITYTYNRKKIRYVEMIVE